MEQVVGIVMLIVFGICAYGLVHVLKQINKLND